MRWYCAAEIKVKGLARHQDWCSCDMRPTGAAAITHEALSTGLRQAQSESTNPVTVGSSGEVQTRCGGDLLQIATGRVREAGESTAIEITAAPPPFGESLVCAGVLVQIFGQCQPVADHSNRANLTAFCFLRFVIVSGVSIPLTSPS
jgi:hypothetical protein